MIASVSFEGTLKEYSYYTNDPDLKEGDKVIVTSQRFGGYSVGIFLRYKEVGVLPKQNIITKIRKEFFEKEENKVLESKEQIKE